MCLEQEDHEILIREYRRMDREDLKANIYYWEEGAEWSH